MMRSLSLASAVLAAATVSSFSMMAPGVAPAHAQAQSQTRWGKGYIPNSTVITQDGKAVKFYDELIRGRIVVVSFIYTSCRDICPLVTARLAQVQEKLGDAAADVSFVSISVDPLNDTPEKLKQHADAFRVGPGWTFVTGTLDDINLIRHKLGDRGQSLSEHRNAILLGNDRTGQWAQDSAFTDLNVLTATILGMDPARRNASGTATAAGKAGAAADAELPGQSLFAKACASCHSIGKGDRVGPDLAGVTTRRDRGWLASFIIAPEAMRAAHDPIALQLGKTYKTVRMPTLGLSEADAADVIGYLEFQNYRLTAPAPATPAGHAHHHH